MSNNNNEMTSTEKFTGTMDVQDKLKFPEKKLEEYLSCLLYTSPSPRDQRGSRMPSSA